ncbi:hypothetical protein E4U51_004161 [Claviceps purpurea]|nr:hypothetical protein E4U51_004161 [Claviceps purpurea]
MDGYAPDNTAPLLPRTEKDEEFASINSQLPQPTIPAESLRRPHPQTYLLSAAAEHYVSNMRSDAVMAEQLSFTTTIPDWPKTSQGGCAYAIHMHDTPEAIAERPWEAIQYAVRRVSPPGDSRSDFLGNVPVKMHKFRCSGLKHCEFVDKALLDPASYRDIGDYWEKLQSVRKSLTEDSEHQGLRDAVTWAWTVKNDYSVFKACKMAPTKQLPSCKPTVFPSSDQAIGGRIQRWIRCINHASADGHQKAFVPNRYDAYITQIEQILTSTDELVCHEGCYVVSRSRRRSKTCDVVHPLSGPGQIKTLECPVIIWFIVPPRQLRPWILINSIGTHSHPPPPPTKIDKPTLQALFNDLREGRVANGNQDKGLRKWQQSPAFQDLLTDFDFQAIGESNIDLINYGYIAYMLRKNQAIHDFWASLRLACLHEWLTYHKGSTSAYIRTVIDTGEEFLAVCFHGSQAQLWSRAPTFQLDTKCKKIHDKVEYEVIFGARIGFGNQYISLARAYMNSRTALAYKRLFQELFSCLEHQCKVQVRWQHIHQQGIIGVTLDQDAGAIQGLGEYLHSIDSSHDVEWHLMNCVRYCQVRFDRSISDQCSELGDSDRSKDSMWQKMKTLPEALTSQAYFESCDMIETGYPCLKYWIRHKKIPIIASGLCHGVSSLSRKHWDSMSGDINGVECLHEQSYKTGGHFISLLYAIKSAEVLDFQQLCRLATASSNSVSTGYPSSVQTQRDETSSLLNRPQQEISGDSSPGHSAQHEPSEEYGYGGPPSEPGDSGVSRPSSPHSTRPLPEIRSITQSKSTQQAGPTIPRPVVPRPILPAPAKGAGSTVAFRPTQPAPAQTQGTGPNVIPRPTQPAAPTKATEPTVLDKIQTLTTFLGNSNVPEELRQHAQAKLKELISNL